MKALITAFILILSANAFATEIYTCEFLLSRSNLVIDDQGAITLEGVFRSYDCSKYTELFPGTVVELNKIKCQSGSKTLDYYITQYSENEIYLSDGLLSREVSCKKQ